MSAAFQTSRPDYQPRGSSEDFDNKTFMGKASEAVKVAAIASGATSGLLLTLGYKAVSLNTILGAGGVWATGRLAEYIDEKRTDQTTEKKRHRVAAKMAAVGLCLASVGMAISAKHTIFPDWQENSWEYAPAAEYSIGPLKEQADDLLIGAGLALTATGAAACLLSDRRRDEDDQTPQKNSLQ